MNGEHDPWNGYGVTMMKRANQGNKQKKRMSEMSSFTLKFQEKDVNDKEYPPLFKFDIIWHIGFCSAIELQCIFKLAPAIDDRLNQHQGLNDNEKVTHFSE